MAIKFTGIRGLGRMDPESRSNMLKIARALRASSQTQKSAPLTNESSVGYAPGIVRQRGLSAGGRTTVTSFGNDVDKPSATYLLSRGTGAFVYIAVDTNKVYMWNGTAYKSSTFT